MQELVKENGLLKEQMETMVEAQVCLFICLFFSLRHCNTKSCVFLSAIFSVACNFHEMSMPMRSSLAIC